MNRSDRLELQRRLAARVRPTLEEASRQRRSLVQRHRDRSESTAVDTWLLNNPVFSGAYPYLGGEPIIFPRLHLRQGTGMGIGITDVIVRADEISAGQSSKSELSQESTETTNHGALRNRRRRTLTRGIYGKGENRNGSVLYKSSEDETNESNAHAVSE